MSDTDTNVKTINKVETEVVKKTEKPKMKSIWYLNDDTTHLDFVIRSMVEVFKIDSTLAFKMALDTHHHKKNGFLVYKAGSPVIKSKAKELDAFIESERETLGYEIRDEDGK
jgi:ATP-dependent Clp protease adapter protein ClpS